jgi:hypothetical protein
MASAQPQKGSWSAVFNAVSKAATGKRVEIEVDSLSLGAQIEAAWLPLLGIDYDQKNDLIEVALDGHDHLIRHPREVQIEEAVGGLTAIRVVDGEGTQQIIKLRDPLMLAPPGG